MKVYSQNFNSNNFCKSKNEHFNTARIEFGANLDKEIQNFKDDLSKFGAVGFLENLNAQKIEDKIIQKQNELSETLGLNDKNLSHEERQNLQITLNKMLQDYRKEIYAKLENNTILQRQNKLSQTPNLADLIAFL